MRCLSMANIPDIAVEVKVNLIAYCQDCGMYSSVSAAHVCSEPCIHNGHSFTTNFPCEDCARNKIVNTARITDLSGPAGEPVRLAEMSAEESADLDRHQKDAEAFVRNSSDLKVAAYYQYMNATGMTLDRAQKIIDKARR